MRFVCDRRTWQGRERNVKFFRIGTSRGPGGEEAQRKNLELELVQRRRVTERKVGRVHQICEEYTRRLQSFAVRLCETTVYSRGKSHTHSWISAKRLYYRQYCAGCVAPWVSHGELFPDSQWREGPPRTSRTSRTPRSPRPRPTDLYFVILFAWGYIPYTRTRTTPRGVCEEIKLRESTVDASLSALQHAALMHFEGCAQCRKRSCGETAYIS